jgi:hypothetical protein
MGKKWKEHLQTIYYKRIFEQPVTYKEIIIVKVRGKGIPVTGREDP